MRLLKFRFTFSYTKESIRDFLGSFVIVTLLIVNIVFYYNYISPMLGNMLYMFLGFFSIILSCVYKGCSKQQPYFAFIIVYSIMGVISYLYNGNANFVELLWPFGFMGIGLLTINFKLKTYILLFAFYVFCLFSIYNIYIYGGSRFIDTQGSRNSISVFSLVYLCLYIFSSYYNKKSVSVLPVIIYFFTSLMATGRGGIVTSTFLLVVFIVFDMTNGNTRMRKIPVIIGTILIAFVVYYIFIKYFEEYISFSISQFQKRGVETTRNVIWSDYIKITSDSVFNILFGSCIKGTIALDSFSHNLHNSFFMLHSKYGLIGIIIVLSMMIKAMKYYIAQRNMYYIIPFVAMLIRMSTDYTNFNGILDIVLINIIFSPFFMEVDKKNEEQALKSRLLVYNK